MSHHNYLQQKWPKCYLRISDCKIKNRQNHSSSNALFQPHLHDSDEGRQQQPVLYQCYLSHIYIWNVRKNCCIEVVMLWFSMLVKVLKNLAETSTLYESYYSIIFIKYCLTTSFTTVKTCEHFWKTFRKLEVSQQALNASVWQNRWAPNIFTLPC